MLDNKALKEFTDLIVNRFRLPGLAVSAYQGGAFLEAHSGSAQLHEPLTDRSQYQVGYITATLLALAALRLSQQGVLDLDESISHYLPDLSSWSREIVVRHLISHTGGFQDEDPNDPDVAYEFSWEDLSAAFKARAIRFSPGTTFSYSHIGSVILDRVIERVTRRSGLSHISELLSFSGGPPQSSQTSHVVKGHRLTYSDPGYTCIQGTALSPLWAAAMLGPTLTPTQLTRIVAAVLSNELLAVPQLFWRRQVTLPSYLAATVDPNVPSHYALGCAEYRDGTYGSSSNFNGQRILLRFLPEQAIIVTVALNASSPIAEAVMRRLLDLITERPVSEAAPDNYSELASVDLRSLDGLYEGHVKDRLRVNIIENELVIRRVHSPCVHYDTQRAILSGTIVGNSLQVKERVKGLPIAFFCSRQSSAPCIMVGLTAYAKVHSLHPRP